MIRFPKTASDIIRHYECVPFTKPEYVTESARQEIFVKYNNQVLRYQFYEFEWKDCGGGVWQITNLNLISMHD